MAVPKGKTTKMKRDKRRTHDVIKKVNIVQCPRCHSMKLAHRVCQECGYYNNQEIIPAEKKGKPGEKAEKKEKAGKKEKAKEPGKPENLKKEKAS